MLRGSSIVAIRRLQTSILARHRKKIKPSSEVLQTLPDIYDIYDSSHVTHKPGNVFKYSYLSKPVTTVSHMQRRDLCVQKPGFDLLDDTVASRVKEDTEQSASEASNKEKNLQDARQLVDMWRKSGKFVPEEMTEMELEEFYKLDTKSSRKKYLKFLARREIIRRTEKMNRLRKAEERAKLQSDDNYGKFEKNTILLFMRNTTMAQSGMWNMARGMKFGPKLVIDHSYESEMNRREIIALGKQLTEVLGAMKTAWEPFHMYWTNVEAGGKMEAEMRRVFGDYLDRMLIDITEESFLDIFPREQLVYLSADSPNELTHYDSDKVYIIGGMVDLSIKPRLSLAKAKRYNIASARLPLDHYMKWGPGGGKNLTVDQMVRIMLEMKTSGDWQQALKHVPIRKIEGMYEQTSAAGSDRKPWCGTSPGSEGQSQQSLTGKFSFSRASGTEKGNKRGKKTEQDQHGLWYGRTPYPEEEPYFTARRKGLTENNSIPPNFAEKYSKLVERNKKQPSYKQRRQIDKNYLKDLYD